MTKVMRCPCDHKGQDEMHGKGMRAHNSVNKDAKSGSQTWRCTACGVAKGESK